MNHRLRPLALLILVLTALAAAGQEQLSLEDYQARLHHYRDRLQYTVAHPESAVDVHREVPDSLQVQTPGGAMTVSMDFLHKGLEAYLKAAPAYKAGILSQLQDRLQAMETEAGRYASSVAADQKARDRLDRILAAREFNRLRGPTEWELLQQRINAWLEKQFNKISPKIPDINQAGQIFVWVMIALASAVLAVWLYRRSRERILDRPREILPFMPSAKSWRLWLAEARQKAAGGDWREAIHLGFWAAVSRLESDGMWRPDKARTPREYLGAIPTGSDTRPSFAAVTRTFESAWYGARPASAVDFDRFMNELEKLGCRG